MDSIPEIMETNPFYGRSVSILLIAIQFLRQHYNWPKAQKAVDETLPLSVCRVACAPFEYFLIKSTCKVSR